MFETYIEVSKSEFSSVNLRSSKYYMSKFQTLNLNVSNLEFRSVKLLNVQLFIMILELWNFKLWSFKCQRIFSNSNHEFNIFKLEIQNLNSTLQIWIWILKVWHSEIQSLQVWHSNNLEVQSFTAASKFKFWKSYFEMQNFKLEIQ